MIRKDRVVSLGAARFKRGDIVSFLGEKGSSDGKGGRHFVRVADHTPNGEYAFVLTRSELPLESGVHGYHSFQIQRGKISREPGVTSVWITNREGDSEESE